MRNLKAIPMLIDSDLKHRMLFGRGDRKLSWKDWVEWELFIFLSDTYALYGQHREENTCYNYQCSGAGAASLW
jgi:hypothetical protein